MCACLAALPQLFVFAQRIRTGRFSPGSAYQPRVAAVLYSYPLRFISALGLFLSLGVLVHSLRPATAGPAPGGSMPGPMPPETLRT